MTIDTVPCPPAELDPIVQSYRARMTKVVRYHLAGRGEAETAVAGLTIHGCETPAEPGSYLYEPSFAFIIRGSKRVVLGEHTFVYDEAHFLLTAVGLPTVVQVIDASASNPYFSIKWNINLDMARDLITEVDQIGASRANTDPGMSVGPVTTELTSAVMRLVDLLDVPEDIPVLAGPVLREILYRVLNGPAGERLRQAVQTGSQTNRVAKAVRFIRENFARPIKIGELAQASGMGESTLHHHFRDVTAMSPLQFQKQLRLHEARRLMLNDGVRAGPAAHRVGYESATQFNREYRRLFGSPPRQDVKSIRSRRIADDGSQLSSEGE